MSHRGAREIFRVGCPIRINIKDTLSHNYQNKSKNTLRFADMILVSAEVNKNVTSKMRSKE